MTRREACKKEKGDKGKKLKLEEKNGRFKTFDLIKEKRGKKFERNSCFLF